MMINSISKIYKLLAVLLAFGMLSSLSACKQSTEPTLHTEIPDTSSYQTTESIIEDDSQTLPQAPEKENTVSTEDVTEPTEEMIPLKSHTIDTSYGRFVLEGAWYGELDISLLAEEVYIIRGTCKSGTKANVHLFDLMFGKGKGDFVGYVRSDEEVVPVYLQLGEQEPDDTWTEQERQDYYAMQSVFNLILSELDLFDELPTEIQKEVTDVQVSTSYFSLYIPGHLSDSLRADVQDGETVTVSFYGTMDGVGELPLYDFVINGNSELPFGFYTLADGTAVSVDVCNVQDYAMDSWSDLAIQQFNEMMEGINDIIFALEESGNFTY